ncbi:hypothetical protein GCM10010910_10000 [Microbacterium nanhaiense]|uniref:Uncharacterized protein n=1 Tax=Microbacterium nanhaiense TaxID=1301026 RepID=A0ABQ2MZL5_9MICO|nr:hypothetical protein GCM10010910_10000 [Microbacterium nanhaiense]
MRIASTVGVRSNKPRGASAAAVITSVPAAAWIRTPSSPARDARPAKVNTSRADSGSAITSRSLIVSRLGT